MRSAPPKWLWAMMWAGGAFYMISIMFTLALGMLDIGKIFWFAGTLTIMAAVGIGLWLFSKT
jgi:hypothetical protein